MATTVTVQSRRKYTDYFEGKNSSEYVYEAVGVSTPTGAGYYSKSEADSRFVNVTGDTMTGNLSLVDLTASGNVVAATLNTGQGANELYAMDQHVRTTDGVTFATVNTGQGANELYAMNQAVRTTDSPTFATAKLSSLTDGYVPYHVSDAAGLANSVLFTDGTNVGIGTTTPGAKLEVVGNIIVGDTNYLRPATGDNARYGFSGTGTSLVGEASSGIIFDIDNNNNSTTKSFDITHDNGLEVLLRLLENGNLLIGTTTDTGEKLQVDGDAIIGTNATIGTDIGSPVYSSGFAGSGWQYDDSEDRLTVDNLTVRKQMRVSELLVEQVRANRGALVVSPGNAKIASVSGTTATVDTGDDDRFPISLVVDDIIRCQRFSGNGTTVSTKYYLASVDSVTGNDFTFTIIDGTDTVEAEDEVVVVGNSSNTARQNLIYITSSDDNAPYIDILDGVTDGDFTGHQKVRLGKLTGITDADLGGALSGYGLYSDNVYLKGKIVASSGEIGGWEISATEIKDTAGVVGLSSAVTAGDDIRFWAGHATPASAPFSVTEAGSIKAEDGLIGGWGIDSDAIYTGTKKTADGYSTSGISIASNGSIHSPNFYVDSDGEVGIRSKEIIKGYVISDDVLLAHNTTERFKFTTYTKAKQINLGSYVGIDVTLRIVFQLAGDPIGTTVYGRIYRNGVAVGTERVTSDVETYTEDITGWNSGDSLQLYMKTTDVSYDVVNSTFGIRGLHAEIVDEVSGTII